MVLNCARFARESSAIMSTCNFTCRNSETWKCLFYSSEKTSCSSALVSRQATTDSLHFGLSLTGNSNLFKSLYHACERATEEPDIQLFRERLSDKVHATTPKGIVGGFEFTVFQRNLKEWQERQWTYVCEC